MSGQFWSWIVEAYGRPGAAEALLQLQDNNNIDIVTIMFCCWRAEQGHAINETTAQGVCEIIEEWTLPIVSPVRASRRALKTTQLIPEDVRTKIRKEVQAVELALEHLHIDMLETRFSVSAANAPANEKSPRVLASANAALYLHKRYGESAAALAPLQTPQWQTILEALGFN